MLVKELREEAKNLGIANYHKLKKQELIDALEQKKSLSVYEIVLKNKETTLKYPVECNSKQDAVNELHKLIRLPNHSQYRELTILLEGKTILNITR